MCQDKRLEVADNVDVPVLGIVMVPITAVTMRSKETNMI